MRIYLCPTSLPLYSLPVNGFLVTRSCMGYPSAVMTSFLKGAPQMDSRAWNAANVDPHKAGLISALINAPEMAQQAETSFINILSHKRCSARNIAAHLEVARQRAAEGRKKLGRS
jgi:hypothetical protein